MRKIHPGWYFACMFLAYLNLGLGVMNLYLGFRDGHTGNVVAGVFDLCVYLFIRWQMRRVTV